MGYILHKGKVMQISEDRKYKGYCSQNCKSSYTYEGQKYCAPFCDESYKRLNECYESEKPINFLKENGFIKTKEEIKEEYIKYYTNDTFETYWLWVAISDLSNKLAESLKTL